MISSAEIYDLVKPPCNWLNEVGEGVCPNPIPETNLHLVTKGSAPFDFWYALKKPDGGYQQFDIREFVDREMFNRFGSIAERVDFVRDFIESKGEAKLIREAKEKELKRHEFPF